MKEFGLIVKSIFIGNSGVGKSSIIDRYIKNTTNSATTIGVEFYCKKIVIDKFLFKLHIWDLGGQMTYRNIIQNYYRNTAIIFYVFDKSNFESLLDFHSWIETIPNMNNQLLVVIGNKSDLSDNRISDKELIDIINEYKAIYYETSAINNINITEVFENTLKLLHDKLLVKEPNLYKYHIAETYKFEEGIRFASDLEDITIPHKKCC